MGSIWNIYLKITSFFVELPDKTPAQKMDRNYTDHSKILIQMISIWLHSKKKEKKEKILY